MTSRSTTWVAAGATLVLIVFASWLFFDWGGRAGTTIASSAVSVGSAAFAAVCAVTAGRRACGRQRIAWLCFGVGLTGWVIGNAIWAYYLVALQEWPPFPSAADAFYLLLPLSAFAAAVFAPSTGPRAGIRVLLDGILVAAAIFVIAWSVGLHTLYDAGPHGLTFVLSIVYPFADVAMVTMSAALLLKSWPGRRLSAVLLFGAMVSIWVTDSAYAYLLANPLESRDLVVAGWALAGYLAGIAALTYKPLTPADRLRRSKPSRVQLWLPYLPIPFAIVFGLGYLWPRTDVGPVLVTGLVLMMAALLRQLILLSENRQLQDAVAHIALSDPLTGLANRALFTDRLVHAMQLRERTAAPVAVLLADLDDFKLVNDSMGHTVGDELLRSVGARIRDSIRPGDTVARLGGDEFAILVEDAPALADQIAERVVRAFDEPFVVDGRTVYMRLSIGLAAAVGDADVSADELFKRADLAMYSAKRAHVGTRTFTPDMRHDATEMNSPSQQQKTGRRGGVARIQFLGDLRRAIDERELDLVYQPKIDLTTNQAVGVEALIRWPHPEFGLLEPADFLPLVRENGLMEAVTDLVLHRAVEDAVGWQGAGIDLPVAINLSAPSLNDEKLPARLLAVLRDHGMPPTSLTVEITEDLLLASVVRARSVLDQLRGSGVRVAIDDFGTGYAAMTYLHELPIDELKLDRQFIAPILNDERAAAIVRSVIELAAEFGLSTVAEGVENRDTAELLESYGCGFAQGHYFSMPVPAQAIRLGIWGATPDDADVTPSAATPPFWASPPGCP
jgi:diguanylate cyclase (GGDEF)-like protein